MRRRLPAPSIARARGNRQRTPCARLPSRTDRPTRPAGWSKRRLRHPWPDPAGPHVPAVPPPRAALCRRLIPPPALNGGPSARITACAKHLKARRVAPEAQSCSSSPTSAPVVDINDVWLAIPTLGAAVQPPRAGDSTVRVSSIPSSGCWPQCDRFPAI